MKGLGRQGGRSAILGMALCLLPAPQVEAGPGVKARLPPDSSEVREAPATERNEDLETAAMNASAFAEAAQQEGMAASAEEVTRRSAWYGKLYPGQEVDSVKVRRIVLAEKYLEAKGLRPDDPGSDGAGQADFSRFTDPEEAELARRTARLHFLLGREDVQKEAVKLEDRAQIELHSDRGPPAMWSPVDLQVRGDPSECLAWKDQGCLVTLREYNAAAAYYPMSKGIPRDSAKVSILKRYLAEKRLAEDARGQGLDRRSDSLLQRVRGEARAYRWLQSTRALGMPVRDSRLLQAAYAKHYAKRFAPREDIALAVIGSSDSAYIDSLHRVFLAWDRKRAGRKPGMRMDPEPHLPWVHGKPQNLPRDLAALADTFQVGQCSAPHRSPLGFFMVRLTSAVSVPEVPYGEALSELVYLATRDKYLDMDSVVESEARKQYARNAARYAWPDTLALRAWLIPRPEAPAVVKAGPGGRQPLLGDTAAFQAMKISSLALPSELRVPLQEQARKNSSRTFFGPLTNRFGRWYFQVLSRRPARGVMPFRLARKDILDRLTAPLEDEGSGVATVEAQEEVMLNLGLARAFRHQQRRKQMEEEAKAEEHRPEHRPDGRPDSRQDFPAEGLAAADQAKAVEAAARIQREEARLQAEEERMLKTARVDFSRLFR